MSGTALDKAARQAVERRLANLHRFYKDRQDAAATDQELAAVVLDRARAIAKFAEKNGDPTKWYALAQYLDAWCNQHGG
ncbi:hypothetical protein ACFWJ4_16480 [Kitasatospora sp. NPDC127067]|uniref:hypothetical protein n=1 Tax=Kitasatospora sp. NPDC127067 TaxID=3347126 RepID=UPI003654922A